MTEDSGAAEAAAPAASAAVDGAGDALLELPPTDGGPSAPKLSPPYASSSSLSAERLSS
jgi:hypothetical protein